MENEIKVCRQHRGYEVPLIWTMAFNGAEYWCPYCGCNEGMMGAGTNVEKTAQLEVRAAMWKKYTEEFLTARSRLVCSALMWEGKRIKPSELPREELERCRRIVGEYEYKVKL